MKLYVSGPMSPNKFRPQGYDNWNFAAFNDAEEMLVAAGYKVENPAEKGVIEGWTWADYLRYDIRMLLDCDGVARLKGWHHSRGARFEVDVATKLDMDVRNLNEWIGWSQ